jgi:hypothetical protein
MWVLHLLLSDIVFSISWISIWFAITTGLVLWLFNSDVNSLRFVWIWYIWCRVVALNTTGLLWDLFSLQIFLALSFCCTFPLFGFWLWFMAPAYMLAFMVIISLLYSFIFLSALTATFTILATLFYLLEFVLRWLNKVAWLLFTLRSWRLLIIRNDLTILVEVHVLLLHHLGCHLWSVPLFLLVPAPFVYLCLA